MRVLLENQVYEMEVVVDDMIVESWKFTGIQPFECYCVLSGQQLTNVNPELFAITILESE